jgi:hypothetical protein
VTDPEMPLHAKFINAFVAAFRSAGADPFYGIQLPRAMTEAGLADVGYRARVPVAATGTPTVDFNALSVEHVADKFVAAGLLTADELEEGLSQLRTPGSVLLPPIMFAAWGRAR